MKSVFLVALILTALVPQAQANSSWSDDSSKGSECEVVSVVTRCDVEKQTLKRKIARLEKRIRELESQKNLVQTVYVPRTVYVDRHLVYQRTIEKEVVRHNIVSFYLARDLSGYTNSQNNGVSSASVQSSFEPGIKYQYQFNFGLVPELGINIKGNPLFGLGFGF